MGVAALLVSALLTAIYMLTISVRAFFPGKNFEDAGLPDVVRSPYSVGITDTTLFKNATIGWECSPKYKSTTANIPSGIRQRQRCHR